MSQLSFPIMNRQLQNKYPVQQLNYVADTTLMCDQNCVYKRKRIIEERRAVMHNPKAIVRE